MAKEKKEEMFTKEKVVRVYGNREEDVATLNSWFEKGYEIIQVIKFKEYGCVDYVLGNELM